MTGAGSWQLACAVYRVRTLRRTATTARRNAQREHAVVDAAERRRKVVRRGRLLACFEPRHATARRPSALASPRRSPSAPQVPCTVNGTARCATLATDNSNCGSCGNLCAECTCRPSGQYRVASADCCSGLLCQREVCTAMATCGSSGAACSVTSPCCSGMACFSGTCTSSCRAQLAPCTMNSQCCSGTCLGAFGCM